MNHYSVFCSNTLDGKGHPTTHHLGKFNNVKEATEFVANEWPWRVSYVVDVVMESSELTTWCKENKVWYK